MENKYKNGKIYKIISNQTDDIYIGSTTEKLCNRMAKHRHDYRKYKEGKYHYVTSYELLECKDAKIYLIKNFPCNNKEELNAEEGRIIRDTPNCINKCIAGRTYKQYYKDNQEYIRNKTKEYYKDNKEYISERNKSYRDEKKEFYREYYQTYYSENKAKIDEKRNEPFTCECGSTLTKCKKARHYKTKKHQQYIAEQNNEK